MTTRRFVDDEVLPAINDYCEAAELPWPLMRRPPLAVRVSRARARRGGVRRGSDLRQQRVQFGKPSAASRSPRRPYQSKRQRAMILLASATGMSAPQIAAMARTDESHVRKVIHAFNEQGFGSLDPDYRGGRPKKTTPEQRDRIVAVARARPDTQGVALTRWSLAKLAEHLAGMGIVLCEEALRQTLRARGPVASAHPLVEVEPGPRLRGQGRARAGALPRQTRRRRRGLL